MGDIDNDDANGDHDDAHAENKPMAADQYGKSHLIIVSKTPVTALAYFFQAGVLFCRENAKGTALSKVYSEKKTHILIFV